MYNVVKNDIYSDIIKRLYIKKANSVYTMWKWYDFKISQVRHQQIKN